LLTDSCKLGDKYKPMAQWKKPKFSTATGDTRCQQRTFKQLFDIPRLQRNPVLVMRGCAHNEAVALRNRYLLETEFGLSYNYEMVDGILDDLASKLIPNLHPPITVNDFMESKKGSIRNRYDKSVLQILNDGFKTMAPITAFVKLEKYNETEEKDITGTIPRLILGRDPAFNVAYARYTIPLEEAFLKLPEVAKGRNLKQRGDQFREKVYGDWYAEVDFSKFDSTQRVELLEHIELGIWKRVYPEQYETIRDLFYIKNIKKGHTMNGCKFSFVGCRGTGDMDTGLFNTMVSWVTARYFEIINKTGYCNFMADGDDHIIKIPVGKSCVNTYPLFGLDAKLVIKKDYHDVDFCSSRFVMINRKGEFYQVQNITKLFNNVSTVINKNYENSLGTYFQSLGYMYSTLYPNFPLLTSFSGFLKSIGTPRYVSYEILEKISYGQANAFKMGPVSLDVDYDFVTSELYMCFGITPHEMDHQIHYFNTTRVDLEQHEDKAQNRYGKRLYHLTRHDYDVCETMLP